jgi:hypothetical protein
MGVGVANFMAKNGRKAIEKSISVPDFTVNVFIGQQLTLGVFGQFVGFTLCWL